MAAKLTTLTNADADFYRLLGPFLARKEVHRQVGGTIWDEDGKVWLVARDRQGTVVGFCGVRTQKGTAVVESCYVTPGNDDVRALLVKAAVKQFAPTPLTATGRNEYAGAYRAHGFAEVGTTGKNFVRLALRPE